MAKKQEAQKSTDIWMVLAIVGVIASLSSFYFLTEQTTLVKVIITLVGFTISVVLLMQGAQGKALLHFIKETRVELLKVVWPSRGDTLKTTGIVFVAVIIIGIFLWLVDTLFLWLVEIVLR